MSRGPLRCVAAWVTAAGVLVIAGPRPEDVPSATAVGDWDSWVRHDPEHALVTVLGLIAWLVLAWLTVGVVTLAGGRSAGAAGDLCRRLSSVLLPRLLREGLAVALGLSLVAGTAGAAAAAPSPARPATVATGATATTAATAVPSLDRVEPGSLQLAPLPAVPPPILAPAAAPAAAPTAGPAGEPAAGRAAAPAPRPPHDTAEPEVVVHRGDCLWSVVARYLGAEATDEQISRAWPDWYAANRAVIGPDPALLLPGQRLIAPPSR